MKKIFIYALAAATMAVGCQKLQGLGNDNTPVDENDLVEIQFSAASATVVTKAAVDTLAGLDLYVYGLNQDHAGKREINGAKATWSADAPYLTLDGGPYYYNNNDDNYHFYGYHLGDLTPQISADYTASVTINGENDILLAATTSKKVGDVTYEYTARNARTNNVYPHLVFEHALSQFTFAAANLGNSDMTLSGIVVKTPLTGTVTVAGAGQAAVATGNPVDLTIKMDSSEDLEPSSAPVTYTSVGTPVMVFPGSSYEFFITVEQPNLSRTLKVTLPEGSTVEAGKSYAININLYSLEEIKISAELKDWDYESFTVDTEEADEVVPGDK